MRLAVTRRRAGSAHPTWLSRSAEGHQRRYLEQLNLADTAAVLNITPDAVKMRQLRALRRLREILEQ